MNKLPVISGKDCIKCPVNFGFCVKRQEGNHVVLRKDSPYCQLVVPNHTTLDRGTLRAITRQADLSVDEFIKAL